MTLSGFLEVEHVGGVNSLYGTAIYTSLNVRGQHLKADQTQDTICHCHLP